MAKLNPNIKNAIKRVDQADTFELIHGISKGDRYALSKAITIIESDSEKDKSQAMDLLSGLVDSGNKSFRIGITGAPGVGKSTLIEVLGTTLVEKGKKPAVLAIDPSSKSSRGSILGDKTRMSELSQSNVAYIRPSAAGETLGGVSRKTRESILLLEAASYDPVIIETVGVGQSETTVKSMTDLFILVIAPGGGDELQGIKRGIVELADIILINKMDGELKKQALETLLHYKNASGLTKTSKKGWQSRVIGISSLEKEGFENLFDLMQEYENHVRESGHFDQMRKIQNLKWFEEQIKNDIYSKLSRHPEYGNKLKTLKKSIESGNISPSSAASDFFKLLDI